MKYMFFRLFVFLTLPFLLVFACNNLIDPPVPDDETINSEIRKLPDLDQVDGQSSRSGPEGDCLYTYEEFVRNPENINLRPDSTVIFPGALIDGSSVLTGEYDLINAGRRNVNIFLSSYKERNFDSLIVNPDSGKVFEALKGIQPPSIPNLRHKMQNVYSGSQLYSLLPIHLLDGDLINKINSVFDFDDTSMQSRKLVQFIYIYYTATIEEPAKPSDFFNNQVTWKDLEEEISEPVSPVYISSVRYGKMGFVFVESTYDKDALTYALNYAIDNVTGAYADENGYKKIIDESKIKAITIGQDDNVSAENGILINDIAGFVKLRELMTRLKDCTDIASYKPLIYSLSYLKNHKTCDIVLKANYIQRECEDFCYKLTITSIEEGGIPKTMMCEAKYLNNVPLHTVEKYTKNSVEYTFSYWEQLYNYSYITDINNYQTDAKEFINNTVISARYNAYFTPIPTPAPTPTPTPTRTPAPVNIPPVANNDTATTGVNQATNIQVLSNDSDGNNDSLSITNVGNPPHGTAVNNTSYIRYTPDSGYSGSDSFTYTVSDGKGGTDSATVSVIVVNGAPTAVNDIVRVFKNEQNANLNVLANDTDPENDSLQIISISSASHGTVSISPDRTVIRYTPNSDYIGTDSMTYTINDYNTGNNDTATVNITVTNTFELTEIFINSSGSQQTTPHTDLKTNDVESISTAPLINGSPTIPFKYWSISGSATIADPFSASTTVTNFESNVTVTAVY